MTALGGSKVEDHSSISSINQAQITLDLFIFKERSCPKSPSPESRKIAEDFLALLKQR